MTKDTRSLIFFIAILVLAFLLGKYTTAHGAERIVVASTYGDRADIRRTGETHVATGATFKPDKLAVAHKTLPFGTWLLLTRGRGKAVVIVNDRGPFVKGREIDLTPAVKAQLRCSGLCRVKMEIWPGAAGAPLPKPRPDIPEPAIAWGEEYEPIP